MRRALAALLLAAAVLAAPVLSPASTMTFGTPVTVATNQLTGEPGIALDPSNAQRVYAVAPGVDGVWFSGNGGSTFALRRFPSASTGPSPSNDGDSDVAVDANGVLYHSGLLARGSLDTTIPVAVSTDQGVTWKHRYELRPDAAGIVCDRQWTAARGSGIVVHAARCENGEVAWVSTNGGENFTGPHSIAGDVSTAGPLVFGANGVLYQPYVNNSQVRVAKSLDNGETWTRHVVATYEGRILFWPGLDVDATGNVYVAWSESPVMGDLIYPVPPSGGTVYYSRSINAALNWTPKRQISAASRTAIFPWVTAGATGKVDVSFYAVGGESRPAANGSPDLGGPLTTWNVEVAQTLNGTATTPSFSLFTIVPGFHTGSVCTSGLYCIGPQNVGLLNAPTPFDRRVLDFFETAAGANGLLMIAYPKDRPTLDLNAPLNAAQPVVDVMLVRQTGGDKIRP